MKERKKENKMQYENSRKIAINSICGIQNIEGTKLPVNEQFLGTFDFIYHIYYSPWINEREKAYRLNLDQLTTQYQT